MGLLVTYTQRGHRHAICGANNSLAPEAKWVSLPRTSGGVSSAKAYWDEAGHIHEWSGHGGVKEEVDSVCPLSGHICHPGSLHCGQVGMGWVFIRFSSFSKMVRNQKFFGVFLFLLLYLYYLLMLLFIFYLLFIHYIIYLYLSLFITVLLATISKIKKEKKAPPRRPNRSRSQSHS